jgi:DNA-binding HxlR family transcriptional regulator
MVADRKDSAARRLRDESDRGSPGPTGPELSPTRGRRIGGAALEFDGLIHERVRLGIVSALSVSEPLTFTELRHILDTTDGNLSAHARKLEDAGYVDCRKSFAGRVPRTEYRLTKLGRDRLTEYLAHMEALIRMTRDG